MWDRVGNRIGSTWKSALDRAGQPGQAIVELAFMITFVVLLLGAAVDLGLMYKAYQNLINASAEASTYLDLEPKRACGSGCDPIAEADAQARQRFRAEQGGVLTHMGNTMDLNANGTDDYAEPGGSEMVEDMVRIDEADNTQIDTAPDGRFAFKGTYDPAAADAACRDRDSVPLSLTNPLVTSCYIVIRSEIMYRPFLLGFVLGDVRTIRVVSVRRIVR